MKAIIPKWIIVYLWFITLMTLVFTIVGYFMPDVHIVTWKDSEAIKGPLSLYLSRNIAIVVLYIFALTYKRLIVLKAVFILRAVIDLLDFIQDLISGNIIELTFPLAMLLLDLFVIRKLYKLKK